jgi:mannose/fructose/N-acetylgalactosamine-specific phosphotransferase system component IIC
MLAPVPFLWLCALSGLLGLDGTGAIQVMVSRPLVVGGVVGALLGELSVGLTAGGLIELLWAGGLPVGSLVPPDGTVAATIGAAIAVGLASASSHPGGAAAAVTLGVLLAQPAGYLGARAEIVQRHLADSLSRRAEALAEQGRLSGVGSLLMAALLLAWLRGALAMALCLLLFYPAAAWMLGHFPADVVQGLHWAFWLFWLLGLAVAADHFWDRKGLKYAAAVLVVMAVTGTRPGVSQGAVLSLLFFSVILLGSWRWWRARRGEATA